MENLEELMANAEQLIESTKKALEEDKEMRSCIDFALNEWKTNKRWFREEPGRVTTEDVIKMCIEYGWGSKRNFDYKQKREQENK